MMPSSSPTSLLWSKVHDPQLHYIFREQALISLIESTPSKVINHCRTLLHSRDPEEWFMALKVLSFAEIPEAFSLLAEHHASLTDSRRHIVFQYLLQVKRRRKATAIKSKENDVLGVTFLQPRQI